jgi:hypothetical protein
LEQTTSNKYCKTKRAILPLDVEKPCAILIKTERRDFNKTLATKTTQYGGNQTTAVTGIRRGFKRVLASRARHFIQHFFEMCTTMCLGQGVIPALIIGEAGLAGFFQLLSQYPWSMGVILALSMIVPMAVWTHARMVSEDSPIRSPLSFS